jgi:ATP-binding cassette subfamily B protein
VTLANRLRAASGAVRGGVGVTVANQLRAASGAVRGGVGVAVANQLRAASVVTALAFASDRPRAAAVAGLTVAVAALTALEPLWLKLLVDAVTAHRAGAALLVAAGAAATVTASAFGVWLRARIAQVLQERTNLLIDTRLARLSLDVPGLEHHERPDHHDQMAMLREQRLPLSQSLMSLMHAVNLAIYAGITTVLLATVHPVLLLLPLFAAALVVSDRRAERVELRARERAVERTRRVQHLFDLATSAASVKELQVFGLRDELLARHERLWRAVDRIRTVAAVRGACLRVGGWLVFASGYGAAVALALWLVLRGRATVGDALMTLALASQVSVYVQGGSGLLTWLTETLTAVNRYLWLVDYAAAAAGRRGPGPGAPAPERLEDGIHLRHVSLRYAGVPEDALTDVCLRLPAGSVVALVGENGAGKTTLVKLLCGFYEPSEGQVLVDGVDLRRLDLGAWRSRTSAAFQDFARLELLAREAVGVGDVSRLHAGRSIARALERAGAADLPGRLPAGLETQLGRRWEHGVDLSGGEWQKVALARAMMRERPLLLVLDEPTASLDATAEHELFERYASAARESAAAAGTITLLVTHRFSTARVADLIVVLDGGRVAQSGSHEGLVAEAGIYAELYELQARAYR